MLIRYFTLFALACFLHLSCNPDKNGRVCGTDNPLEDLPWLKEVAFVMSANANMIGGQIIQYHYQGNYVFMVNDCYGCLDGLITVHNCDGDVICEFGGIAGLNTCLDFQETATDSTMLLDCVQH
jgi:hypothetical protein